MATPTVRRTGTRSATIMSVAAELFATKGFAGTTIDEIGAGVGITGPAIYRHFSGKDALLAAVVMEAVDAFTVDDGPETAGLEWMVAAAVAAALDHSARLVTYLRERHRLVGDERSALAKAERRLYRPWRECIAAANPELPPTAIAARQLAALTAMGEVASRATDLRRPRLDELLIESVDAVLRVPPVADQPATTGAAAGTSASSTPWSLPTTRRDQIFTEALRLFREHGYHGVGMDEIGVAAGVSGPTIYAHYDSKAALLIDAFDRAGTLVAGVAHGALASAVSATDALDRLATSYLDVAINSSDLIIVTSREIAAIDGADQRRFVQQRSEVLDAWAAVLGELRPALDQRAVVALVGGVLALIEQISYSLDNSESGVPLVQAWCLGPA